MIRALEQERHPPTKLEAEDSLRALSLAENDGWTKLGGLPDGAPPNAVANLGQIGTMDPETREFHIRALLIRQKTDTEFCYVVMPYEMIPELSVVN